MCYNGLSLVKVQDKKYDRVQDRELVMNCNNLITSLGAGWKDKFSDFPLVTLLHCIILPLDQDLSWHIRKEELDLQENTFSLLYRTWCR